MYYVLYNSIYTYVCCGTLKLLNFRLDFTQAIPDVRLAAFRTLTCIRIRIRSSLH